MTSKSTRHGDSIIIFCDGSCIGNPGPGGYGSIVSTLKTTIELGGSFSLTTNNQMEIQAAIEALKYCFKHELQNNRLTLYSDSQYFIQGATSWIHQWKSNQWMTSQNTPVSNQEFWKEWDEISKYFKSIQIKKVDAHSGIPGNERCDQIGKAFAHGESIKLYSGSSDNYLIDLSITHVTSQTATPKVSTAYYLSYVNGVLLKHKTWEECSVHVKGVSGAKYKKVTSSQEELQTIKNWGIQ